MKHLLLTIAVACIALAAAPHDYVFADETLVEQSQSTTTPEQELAPAESETTSVELSDASREKLLKDLSKMNVRFDSEEIPKGAVAIAVPAIFMVFGLPLFLLIAVLIYGHRRRRQKMELINTFLEAGKDVPEHVLKGLDAGGSASSLRSGITLAMVGLGVLVAFELMGNQTVSALGYIPLFLGLGRLIFWFLEERQG